MPSHIAHHQQQGAIAARLQVEEVAAHFRCRLVHGVNLEARRLNLLARNHQFLHAARRGQLAVGALLVMLDAQEPPEDDDDNRQNAGKVRHRSKVNGNRPGLQCERRAVRVAGNLAHAAGQYRLRNAHHIQDERNQQQAGFEVAAHGGANQRRENENQPADKPQKSQRPNHQQQQPCQVAFAHQQQHRSHAGQHWRGVPQRANVPALLQFEKADQKLEVEIRRDHHQLHHGGHVHQRVHLRGAAGEFHKAQRRQQQLMQRQPQVFNVSLLRKVERQQKQCQHQQQHTVHQPRQPLQQRVGAPNLQPVRQVVWIAQRQLAVCKKSRVRAVAHRNVNRPQHQHQVGLFRRHIQRIDARDLLVVFRLVAVRALGRNRLAVGIHIDKRSRIAQRNGRGLRDGQFHQQRHRPMPRRQLDVLPEPHPWPLMRRGSRLVLGRTHIAAVLGPFALRCARGVVLVRHVSHGGVGVAHRPLGVVEFLVCHALAGRNTHPPALQQTHRRTHMRRVQQHCRRALRIRRGRRRMLVQAKHPCHRVCARRRMVRGRRRLRHRGNQSAKRQQGNSQASCAHQSSNHRRSTL